MTYRSKLAMYVDQTRIGRQHIPGVFTQGDEEEGYLKQPAREGGGLDRDVARRLGRSIETVPHLK